MSRTRRRVLGLLAATALTIAVVPLAAFGDAPEGGAVTIREVSQLVLETGGETLTVRYVDAAGNETVRTQSVGKPERCLVDTATLSSPPESIEPTAISDLLVIEVSAPEGLGLVGNGLGSSDGKQPNCKTDSGRVEYGETMTLSLGALLDGLVIGSAVLDVEGKFGAGLTVTPTMTGGPSIPPFENGLVSGTDNGADSGGSDNDLVTVDPGQDFDGLTLTVKENEEDQRGAFSLEGGGDYGAAAADNRTVFNLVSEQQYANSLDCTDHNQLEKDFSLDENDGSALRGVVTRYDTVDKDGGDCKAIGVELTSDGDGITLDNSISDEFGNLQSPNLRLVLEWRVELKDENGNLRPMDGPDGVYAELDRKVDLLDGSAAQSAQYCLSDGIDDDGVTYEPAVQPDEDTNWCLLSDSTETFDGYLVQTQVYDGAGDPRFF